MAIPFSPSRSKLNRRRIHRSSLDLSLTRDMSLSSQLLYLAIMEAWRYIKSGVVSDSDVQDCANNDSDGEDVNDDEDNDQMIETLENISRLLKTRRMSLPATLPDIVPDPILKTSDSHATSPVNKTFRLDKEWIVSSHTSNNPRLRLSDPASASRHYKQTSCDLHLSRQIPHLIKVFKTIYIN